MRTVTRIYITSFLSVVYAPFAIAQQKLPGLSLKNVANVKSYISRNYKISSSFLDTACFNTIILVKFKVSHNQVSLLDLSKDGPFEIKEALKAALLSTNGMWKSSRKEERALGQRTFLLPVVFYYQIGCWGGGQLVEKVVKAEEIDLSAILKNRPDSSLHTALRNLLIFEKGADITTDCILINHMEFFAYQ